jgi:hypothetical protein
MCPEMSLAEVLEQGFKLLRSWKYRDLGPEQKRTLYVYHLWKDGASEETAVDAGMHSSPAFIDGQLRMTFCYEEESVV